LIKGSIISAAEGDVDAARRAQEMGRWLIEHIGPAPLSAVPRPSPVLPAPMTQPSQKQGCTLMELQKRGESTRVRKQLDEVTDALEALTAALDDDGALDTTLELVCRQLIRVVPGADIASVTLICDGAATTAAFTDQRAVDLDIDQYVLGHGPCLEAAATGKMLRLDIESAQEQWPDFTRRALAAGVASYLSAPLAVDAGHSGSLNLYGMHAHGYREVEGALLEVYLTAVEAALRSTARYLAARDEAAHLTNALVSRAVIDQAKGILMGAHGITAEEAFHRLVEQSQRENVKLRDVAERFVARVVRSHPTVEP
jgi:hypothetical protein